MLQGGSRTGLSATGTFERSSDPLARVAFCRSLREAGTVSELSGMVTAHFEWSICFCTPRRKASQTTLESIFLVW